MSQFTVIVSSPLGFTGTTVKFEEMPFPTNLSGCTSYVGHPTTKGLLEALGATTISGKWEGPKLGESYLAVPLANNKREAGYTVETAIEDISSLRCILCTRIA